MCDVVLVEDDLDLQTLTTMLLEVRGHATRVFGAGRAALESCSTNPPDVVLLDWSLPEMTGLEILRALRADPRTRNVPVVMVTAMDSAEHIAAAFESGAQEYVCKPYSVDELIGAVNRQVPEQGGRGRLIA